MTEVFVHQSRTFGGHRNQQLDLTIRAGKSIELLLLRGHLCLALPFNLGLVGLAGFRVVVDFHCHDLVSGELGAAVLAQQSDRIGAALTAMTHHVHLAFAAVLQRLELLRALTARLTSTRCLSLMPGIMTELTLQRMPRAVSISRPIICRSASSCAASLPT